MLTSFVAYALTDERVRSVRKKVSKSQWSRWERFLLETEENSHSSALPHPGATSSVCQGKEKGETCCFLQKNWAFPPGWFTLLRNPLWFISCWLRSLLFSCQTYSKAGCSALFSSPAFTGLTKKTWKELSWVLLLRAEVYPFHLSSNIPFACLGWWHMLVLVQVCSHSKAGGKSKSPYRHSLLWLSLVESKGVLWFSLAVLVL